MELRKANMVVISREAPVGRVEWSQEARMKSTWTSRTVEIQLRLFYSACLFVLKYIESNT